MLRLSKNMEKKVSDGFQSVVATQELSLPGLNQPTQTRFLQPGHLVVLFYLSETSHNSILISMMQPAEAALTALKLSKE
jgi:hypothetical protein